MSTLLQYSDQQKLFKYIKNRKLAVGPLDHKGGKGVLKEEKGGCIEA